MNAIDRHIAAGMPPGRMEEQAAKLRALKDRMGWTTGMMAERWRTDPATVRKWLGAKVPIPGTVLRLMEIER